MHISGTSNTWCDLLIPLVYTGNDTSWFFTWRKHPTTNTTNRETLPSLLLYGVRQSVLIRKPEYLLSSLLFNRVTKIAEKDIISTAVADITKEARRARGTMSISNAYRKHLDCSFAWRLRWNSPRQKCWWYLARITQHNPKRNLLGFPSPIDTYLYARICAGEAAELFKNKRIMAQTPKFHISWGLKQALAPSHRTRDWSKECLQRPNWPSQVREERS